VRTINANGKTTNLPSPKKQNTGAIAGGTIGGVAAIIAAIGIVAVIRRRWRWRRSGPRSIFSTDSVVYAGPQMARLRAEALSSPEPHNLQASALNMSQSTSPQNAVTESGGPPLDTRRFHSEFESLRREVERLGLVVAAPPSYAEGDG